MSSNMLHENVWIESESADAAESESDCAESESVDERLNIEYWLIDDIGKQYLGTELRKTTESYFRKLDRRFLKNKS